MFTHLSFSSHPAISMHIPQKDEFSVTASIKSKDPGPNLFLTHTFQFYYFFCTLPKPLKGGQLSLWA